MLYDLRRSEMPCQYKIWTKTKVIYVLLLISCKKEVYCCCFFTEYCVMFIDVFVFLENMK